MIEEEGTQPVGLSPVQKVTRQFGKNVVIGILLVVAAIVISKLL